MTGWLTGARGELCDQALVGRPLTPETLRDRVRAELTGMKDNEVASGNGSGFDMELNDVVVDMSMDECCGGAAKI